jgi:hypothetical protein
MSYLGDNKWEVNVSGLPSGLVEYYVFAADESGRSENHPYIGAPDPHKFILTTPEPAPILSLNKTSSYIYTENVEVIEDYIIVSNVGNAELSFEIKDIVFDCPSMLTIDPEKGTVQEGESQIITLTYNFNNAAKMVMRFEGFFNLSSNDPANSEVIITLTADLHVGVNELNTLEINIYPNPTTGELRIENGEWRMENGELRIENGEWRIENVEIFDVMGKKQSSKHLITTSSHHLINISHLNTGVYFLRITNDLGNSVIKKIIKL